MNALICAKKYRICSETIWPICWWMDFDSEPRYMKWGATHQWISDVWWLCWNKNKWDQRGTILLPYHNYYLSSDDNVKAGRKSVHDKLLGDWIQKKLTVSSTSHLNCQVRRSSLNMLCNGHIARGRKLALYQGGSVAIMSAQLKPSMAKFSIQIDGCTYKSVMFLNWCYLRRSRHCPWQGGSKIFLASE